MSQITLTQDEADSLAKLIAEAINLSIASTGLIFLLKEAMEGRGPGEEEGLTNSIVSMKEEFIRRVNLMEIMLNQRVDSMVEYATNEQTPKNEGSAINESLRKGFSLPKSRKMAITDEKLKEFDTKSELAEVLRRVHERELEVREREGMREEGGEDE